MRQLFEYIIEAMPRFGGSDPSVHKNEETKNIETLVKCAEELGLKNIQWKDNNPGNKYYADRYAQVIIGDPKDEVCLYVQIWGGSGPLIDFLDNLGKEKQWENGKFRIPEIWRINANKMRRHGDVEGACIYALKNAMKLQPKLKHIPDE